MSLCCSMIDRWDWRRKVTGALEVTVELEDLGLAAGGGCDKQVQITLEIASCHPYQKAHVQFGGFAAHAHTRAQSTNQHLQRIYALTSEHGKTL